MYGYISVRSLEVDTIEMYWGAARGTAEHYTEQDSLPTSKNSPAQVSIVAMLRNSVPGNEELWIK